MHLRCNILLRVLLLAVIFVSSAAISPVSAQTDRTDTYFPYPTVPDTITNFYGRTDYLVTHFWDRCNFKTAFSSRQKMAGALRDYLTFMPYATRRVAHRSVANLIKGLEKQPEDLLFMANKAEEYMYGDSAMFVSEELFLPFARAIATNKKIDKAERARFDRLSQQIMRSQIGAPAPYIDFTDRNSEQRNLSQIPDTASITIVIIDTPDCFDCRLARTRLNADITFTQLIDEGSVKVVDLTPGEPSEEWKAAVASYPEKWIVGASPNISDYIDLKGEPMFLLLDRQGLIRVKSLKIEDILKLVVY